MANDSWTGARLGTMDDAPLGGLYLAEVVTELGPWTFPAFVNIADRDTKFGAWLTAGNADRDGMRCSTLAEHSEWVRSGGSWQLAGNFGPWSSYVPTWQTPGATTQPAIGNGILAGRYRQLDAHTGFLKLQLTIGTTSGGGSAPATSGYQLGFPSGWVNGPMSSALTGYFKGTGDSGPLGAFVSSGESRILEMRAAQNDAIVGNGLLTVPGDYIIVSGMVELA